MLILPQSYHRLWEQIRSYHIKLSASVVPDAFGLGYRSRRAVWLEKCSQKVTKDSHHLIQMKKYGQEKEIIAKKHILKMELFNKWRKFNLGFWRYAKNPSYGFSPDVVLVHKEKLKLSGNLLLLVRVT